MRLVIASVSNFADVGDVTTLANPEVVEDIRHHVQSAKVAATTCHASSPRPNSRRSRNTAANRQKHGVGLPAEYWHGLAADTRLVLAGPGTGEKIWLFPVPELSGINAAAQLPGPLPGLVIIGTDGGSEMLALDGWSEPSPVVLVDVVFSGWDDAIWQAPDLAAVLRKYPELRLRWSQRVHPISPLAALPPPPAFRCACHNTGQRSRSDAAVLGDQDVAWRAFRPSRDSSGVCAGYAGPQLVVGSLAGATQLRVRARLTQAIEYDEALVAGRARTSDAASDGPPGTLNLTAPMIKRFPIAS
jgi:hypothetical protein